MSELNEEEIIKETNFIIKWISKIGLIKENKAIRGLLDLYQKEKEKNKILDNMLLVNKEQYEFIKNKDNYISKDKVREKIEELDKKMAEDEVDEFGIHSQGWAALDWTRDFLLELLQEGE